MNNFFNIYFFTTTSIAKRVKNINGSSRKKCNLTLVSWDRSLCEGLLITLNEFFCGHGLMEFAKELIRDVIRERISYSFPLIENNINVENQNDSIKNINIALNEAETFLSNGLSVSIHVLIGHTNCNAIEPIACKANRLIEVWTLQITSIAAEKMLKPFMIPMFLKQAIRSQLYFSPTKSWFSNKNNNKKINNEDDNTLSFLSNSFCCYYKIMASPNFQNEVSNDEFCVDEHKFPACKLDNRSLLNIYVKWLKKKYFPTQILICPNRIENDLWMVMNKGKSYNYTDGELALDAKKSEPILIQNVKKILNNKEISKINNSPIINKNNKQNLLNLPLNNEKEIIKQKIKKCRSTKTFSTKNRSSSIPREIAQFSTILQLPLLNNEINLKKKLNEYSILNNTVNTFCDKENILQTNKCLNLSKKKTLIVAPTGAKTESLIIKPNFMNINKQQRHSFIKPNKAFKPSLGLLCNFEESALKGRLHPIHTVDGFQLQIVITGNSYSSRHFTAPVTTFYFNEEAPSLYMCNCNISNAIKKSKIGIQLPKQCILQAILLNPQGSVVKIFLVNIDVKDMPPLSQTFIRQKIMSTSNILKSQVQINNKYFKNSNVILQPSNKPILQHVNAKIQPRQNSVLKFLINLRLASDRCSRIFLHSDIKMLLSNKSADLEGFASIETKYSTQMPKYSPIK